MPMAMTTRITTTFILSTRIMTITPTAMTITITGMILHKSRSCGRNGPIRHACL